MEKAYIWKLEHLGMGQAETGGQSLGRRDYKKSLRACWGPIVLNGWSSWLKTEFPPFLSTLVVWADKNIKCWHGIVRFAQSLAFSKTYRPLLGSKFFGHLLIMVSFVWNEFFQDCLTKPSNGIFNGKPIHVPIVQKQNELDRRVMRKRDEKKEICFCFC